MMSLDAVVLRLVVVLEHVVTKGMAYGFARNFDTEVCKCVNNAESERNVIPIMSYDDHRYNIPGTRSVDSHAYALTHMLDALLIMVHRNYSTCNNSMSPARYKSLLSEIPQRFLFVT